MMDGGEYIGHNCEYMKQLEDVRLYILDHLIDREFLAPGELAIFKDIAERLVDPELNEELREYELWYAQYWPNISK